MMSPAWNLNYFGSDVKFTSRKNSASVGLCTLVSAGFFWFVDGVVHVRKRLNFA